MTVILTCLKWLRNNEVQIGRPTWGTKSKMLSPRIFYIWKYFFRIYCEFASRFFPLFNNFQENNCAEWPSGILISYTDLGNYWRARFLFLTGAIFGILLSKNQIARLVWCITTLRRLKGGFYVYWAPLFQCLVKPGWR